MEQPKESNSQGRPQAPKSGGILGALRANFLTGLVVLVPVGLTAYIFWTAIGIIDSWVLPWIPEKYHPSAYIGVDVHGIGSAIFLVFCVVVGYFAKGLIGRWILRWAEHIVGRMPLVRSVYQALKQIAETVFQQGETSFDRACLIEYPRKGLWAMAFYSTTTKGEILEKTPDVGKMISVFLPTTPNPTSGFLLFVPETDVIFLDMSVEDAAKLVISAGLVYPVPKSGVPALPSGNDNR
ncbi:MAG: DUF502 domain-containing protein [Albidovulum sp.]|nr:DUF502 domain-containing protein [Albidovulum sp.]MDE0303745.1 DUF502 domain-containing protein [Albidovulum sp.]MDE0532333.1 DUF502 domain-containing protein [Albidovulum sp.]